MNARVFDPSALAPLALEIMQPPDRRWFSFRDARPQGSTHGCVCEDCTAVRLWLGHVADHAHTELYA